MVDWINYYYYEYQDFLFNFSIAFDQRRYLSEYEELV